MNDPTYDPLYQQAIQLNHKFNDFIGGGTHPQYNTLQHEVRQLIEDIEVKKNPRTIEGRIKTIQNQLKQTQRMPDQQVNYQEFDYMHDNYEHMRQSLRHFDNY